MTTQRENQLLAELEQLGRERIGAYQFLALAGATPAAFQGLSRIDAIERRQVEIEDELTRPEVQQ